MTSGRGSTARPGRTTAGGRAAGPVRRRPRVGGGPAPLGALIALFLVIQAGCGGPTVPPSTAAISADTPGSTAGDPDISGPGSDLIEGLLARMDTRQKAAQLLVVGFPGTAVTAELAQLLQEGPVGGVLLYERNVESPEQLAALTTTLQRAAEAGGSGLPLLVAVDQEGGGVRRVREGVPDVPSARTAAATLTSADVRDLSTRQAEALLRLGINTNLAPVADVVGDSSSFLYQRSYGGDPGVVSAYVSAVVEGQEAAGLISVVKHFPGHGATTGDSHLGRAFSALGPEEFWAVHLRPFEAALRAGVPAVLVSHLVAEGLGATAPSSVSERVIEGLLRTSLGFEGVVVTDDMEMAGLPAGGANAPDAVLAGADLVIVGHTAAEQRVALEALVAAAESGGLPMQRLDAAVARVLLLKSEYGLF